MCFEHTKMGNPGAIQLETEAARIETDSLIESLRSVLPGFGEITAISIAPACVQFRAQHGSGQSYSVFVTPEQLAGFSEADRQGFLPDAKIAMGVQHPNLIQALHVTRIPGHYALVTELAEGLSLGQLIREKRIDGHTAVQLLRPVVEAVGKLHEAGVLHRTLNLEAIIAQPDGTFRILGAGFSNLLLPLWQKNNERHHFSAQPFFAQESGVGGLVSVDKRADIFGLGMVHYVTLTGVIPKGSFFALPSKAAKVESHVDCAVSRAIQSKPEQRHQNVDELVEELLGLRPREEPKYSSKEETKKSKQDVRSEDGLLSWITKPRILICFFFLLFGSVGLGYIVWEQKNLGNSLNLDDLSEILAKLASAEADLAAARKIAALAKLTEVANTAKISPQVLAKLIGMLVKHGEYDEALKLAEIYAARAGKKMPDYEEFMALFNKQTHDIREFIDVDELAKIARDAGQSRTEHDLLLRAAELMPEDEAIQKALAENPCQIQKLLLGAIRQLKVANPKQESWRFFANARRGSASLSLAGNPYLTDLSALRGVPLISLDLSDTGVSDLLPLATLPLQELRIDHSPVHSLDPLEKVPLRLLAIRDVQVPLPGDAWFTSIPHRPGDRTATLSAPTEPVTWENSIGIRFHPLVAHPQTLVATRETSIAEFEKFLARSSQSKRKRSLQVYRDATWQRIETDNWRDPGFELSDSHPVVGVAYSECEEFCDWLTKKERMAGILSQRQSYRLPSDYEWSQAAGIQENPMLDAAARTVSQSVGCPGVRESETLTFSEGYADEASTDVQALADGQWIRRTATAMPVGGFYDLSNNAREWCSDEGEDAAVMRTVRGGGAELAHGSRKQRTQLHRLSRFSDVGFRIVLQLYPPRDYKQLAQVLAEKDGEKARQLARDFSLQGRHTSVRQAGDCALQMIALMNSAPNPDHCPQCPEFQGRHYMLARLPATWTQASTIAENLGAHLLTVTSTQEEDWIKRHFFTNQPAPPAIWLGATNGTGGDRWSWVNSEPWSTSPPTALPPAQSDPQNPDYRESALVLAPGASLADGNQPLWKKRPCTENHAFIIEWEDPAAQKTHSPQAIRPGQPRNVNLPPGENTVGKF